MSEAATETKTPKARKRGVGTVIREALRAGDTNEQALAKAKTEFPESSTTLATVAWYRNNERKQAGSGVPSAREVKKTKNEQAADPLDA